ncbi:hypothetical protein [Piscinibacter sakaiensis]|uniref:hypothetical protein n=1 Tax=Piscinibacter sakaiensis TaxID=1547922 RepID=UPI003AB02310
MLTLTAEQFARIGADQKQAFVDRLIAQLRQDFPQQTSPRDDTAMRQLVDTGSRNAETYGLVGEAHIRFYCGLMLRHGEDFDTDPKQPWAGEILDDDALSATEKVARLDEVQVFLDRPSG